MEREQLKKKRQVFAGLKAMTLRLTLGLAWGLPEVGVGRFPQGREAVACPTTPKPQVAHNKTLLREKRGRD